MRKFVVAVPIMLMAGCSAAGGASQIASTVASNVPTLTQVASAACTAQASINTLGTVAQEHGDTVAAQIAAKASAAAGKLCTW